MGRGDLISAGNLDLWESISAGNLHRGIPSLQETQMGGGGGTPYLQETEIGGSHICRKPRWGGGEPISAGNLDGLGDPISAGNLDREVDPITAGRQMWDPKSAVTLDGGGGGDPISAGNLDGGIPYLQEI